MQSCWHSERDGVSRMSVRSGWRSCHWARLAPALDALRTPARAWVLVLVLVLVLAPPAQVHGWMQVMMVVAVAFLVGLRTLALRLRHLCESMLLGRHPGPGRQAGLTSAEAAQALAVRVASLAVEVGPRLPRALYLLPMGTTDSPSHQTRPPCVPAAKLRSLRQLTTRLHRHSLKLR